MAARVKVAVDVERDAEFDRAFGRLAELVDLSEADERHPVRGNAVYTTSVVLWMLVYQRSHPDSSLEAAVKRLVDSQPSLLRDHKRVRDGLSIKTGSYSQARSRLPMEAAEWFADQVSRSLIDATPPSFGDRRVFLIDGTTIALAPEPALAKAFPPASNQHGEGVWPIALLTVCHELSSGAALVPEIGAMFGPNAVSETALVSRNLRKLPPRSIVIADGGFGIFRVAQQVHSAGHDFLLRLTPARFRAMQKTARLIDSGNNFNVWTKTWKPSLKDRQTNPDLPPDAALEVRLHEIVINSELTLYLVTGLSDSSPAVASLYECRNHVEVDIRNLKVVLKTEAIRARSVDTFRKELLASIVSYNLVTQFRCQAAALIQEPPRRLSFKRVWTTFQIFLMGAMHTSPADWRKKYALALSYATQDKLPHRPGRRFPREAHPKRPKSNQFKKRKPKPT